MKYTKIGLVIASLFPSLLFAQSIRSGLGVEFSYNGHFLDQANSTSFSTLLATQRFSSQRNVQAKIQEGILIREFVSPFVNTSINLTKQVNFRSGTYLIKGGLCWMEQVGSVRVEKQEQLDINTYKTTRTEIETNERTVMLQVGMDRVFFLRDESKKVNVIFSTGVNAGAGIANRLQANGSISEYTTNGSSFTSKVDDINEVGQVVNSFYYAGKIGIGPKISLGSSSIYVTFDLIVGKVRKENTASFDVINTSVQLGFTF